MSELLAPLKSLPEPDDTTSKSADAATLMVEQFVIDSQETYGLAADELRAIKAKMDDLEGKRTAITKPINDALRAVNALFRGPMDKLETASRTLSGKMLTYQREEQRKADERRREEERIAREAAEKAEAKAAALREQATAAAAAAPTPEAAAEVIQAAELQAAELHMTAVVSAQAIAPVAAPKVKGLSTVSTAVAELDDKVAFLKHVLAEVEAGRTGMLDWVNIDSVRARAWFKAMGASATLPGWTVGHKQHLSVRR